MSLSSRRIRLIVVDFFLVTFSTLAAFVLHYDAQVGEIDLRVLFPVCLLTAVFRLLAFYRSRLYEGLLDYASIGELIGLSRAVAVSSVLSGVVLLATAGSMIPWTIIVTDGVLCLFIVGGSRLAWRVLRKKITGRGDTKIDQPTGRTRALFVGAGDTGELVVREMLRRPDVRYVPVGFVDDDINKIGLRIHGIPILGTTQEIPQLVAQHDVDEVIVTVASASRELQRGVVDLCKRSGRSGVLVKTVPGIRDLICGDVQLSKIRDVREEELLDRSEAMEDEDESIGDAYRGKSIMVTGAAGSIGQELCRQLLQFDPDRLILFDHNENNMYFLTLTLRSMGRDTRVVPAIGDVRDEPRVSGVMKQYRPQILFHAAAHKHVPLMELCVGEGVKNNVLGTLNVAKAADRWGTERFVLISTDKAVNPLNIMGATKRVAELIIQSMAQQSSTSFTAVRFGNVLGSEGSVIPLFKRQIRLGGPVTVTHPDAVRYLMTIAEAVRLVIRAGTLGGQGEILVLKMGQPVRILDLAENLVRLSGLEPGRDIEIEYVGLRPGEKLREELWNENEHVEPTPFEPILSVVPASFDGRRFCTRAERLARQVVDLDRDEVMERLTALVPEYRPVGREMRQHIAELRSDLPRPGTAQPSVLRRWPGPLDRDYAGTNVGANYQGR